MSTGKEFFPLSEILNASLDGKYQTSLVRGFEADHIQFAVPRRGCKIDIDVSVIIYPDYVILKVDRFWSKAFHTSIKYVELEDPDFDPSPIIDFIVDAVTELTNKVENA